VQAVWGLRGKPTIADCWLTFAAIPKPLAEISPRADARFADKCSDGSGNLRVVE
jgi:hypothetical protein